MSHGKPFAVTEFEQEGVDSAFWFTFGTFGTVHNPDEPRLDLDMAAYGVVKMLPKGTEPADMTHAGIGWEPKEAFHALAAAYSNSK